VTGIHLLTLAVPVIACFFSILFFGIWQHWKALRYLPWLASAFLLFGTAILLQLLVFPRNLEINILTCCVLYTGATLVFAQGTLRRLGLRPNYRFNFAVAFSIFWGTAYFVYRVPDLDARIYILNFGIALVLLATALRMRNGARQLIDRALLWTLLVFSLQFFPRTLLTLQHLPDTRDLAHVRQYAQSPFWIWLNLSFLVFTVLIGLVLSVAIGSDIVAAVKQEAMTDSLTMLLNRRGFEAFAKRLAASAKGRRQSLILLDLDDFKAINDAYGHHAGDLVLERVGALLRSHIRASDAAVRLGGEEFAVFLYDIAQSEGYEIAERLRHEIASIRFKDHPLRSLTFTASVGVVEIRPGEALVSTLQRADELMYTAKRIGKNRTVSAADLI
jgi:diguanylate cyclase (GGDEF)-like protein